MRALLLTALLTLAGCAGPDLPRFEKALAANDSATVALGQWCVMRNLGNPPTIRALADRSADAPASPAVRATLGVSGAERVAYRHVRLTCGDRTLSIAHNWYVPARLTPEMNRAIETTDAPFGKVVAPLGFRRERLASKRGRMIECPSGTALSHRAALRLADGRAISVVIECYTRANLSRAG